MELEKIVANNIADLRKSRKMTQVELAAKIDYSDKAVSKWERGEALPDVKTLCRMAELFEVTLDYFVTENAIASAEEFSAPAKESRGYRIVIALMASCAVWGGIVVAYVYALLYLKRNLWPLFVWGVPISALAMEILVRKWKVKNWSVPLHSVFFWGLLASVYLTFLKYNIWPIFLVGIPIQIILILWEVLRRKFS